jgi:hypothetical protein
LFTRETVDRIVSPYGVAVPFTAESAEFAEHFLCFSAISARSAVEN